MPRSINETEAHGAIDESSGETLQHPVDADGTRAGIGVVAVIPALDESATIAEVVRRTLPYVDAVIVVDDGSTDGTGDAVEALPATLLRHEKTAGKGAALRTGLLAAVDMGADDVVTLDGDLQHRPEDIPRLVAAARRRPNTMIVASRFERAGAFPWHRKLANRIANFWISKAAGQPIDDSQCGFRLYPKRLLGSAAVLRQPRPGFVFESEVIIDACRAGFGIDYVSIDPIYPKMPARRSHYRAVKDTIKITSMVAGKILSRRPTEFHSNRGTIIHDKS